MSSLGWILCANARFSPPKQSLCSQLTYSQGSHGGQRKCYEGKLKAYLKKTGHHNLGEVSHQPTSVVPHPPSGSGLL